MTSKLLSRFTVILGAFVIFLIASPQSGHAVTKPAYWTVHGPGDLDLFVDGNKVIFSYELDVRRDFGVFEWRLTGHRFPPAKQVFDWDYSGSHDSAQNATVLTAPDHTLVTARSGRGEFLYEGRGLTIENDRTDNFRFIMTATNDDATKLLSGTLEITQVPVPAAVWMMTLAFSGLFAMKFGANRRNYGFKAAAFSKISSS